MMSRYRIKHVCCPVSSFSFCFLSVFHTTDLLVSFWKLAFMFVFSIPGYDQIFGSENDKNSTLMYLHEWSPFRGK